MSSKEGMVMNIVEADTRPRTNAQRLEQYESKMPMLRRPRCVVMTYTFQGTMSHTVGMDERDCIARTHEKCGSPDWELNDIETRGMRA